MANSSAYFDDTYWLAFLDLSLGWAVSPADEAAYSVPVTFQVPPARCVRGRRDGDVANGAE
jgi:hypothetical protein